MPRPEAVHSGRVVVYRETSLNRATRASSMQKWGTLSGHALIQHANATMVGWLSGGFYALSASKAIFRARTYNCNLFSPVMMIT